jgi:purine-nucleoside phosphorylase
VELIKQVTAAASWIRERDPRAFDLAIILGTGLGALADECAKAQIFEYNAIPFFPESTVKFHAGRLVLGELEGKTLFAMQGRFHGYEGYPMRQITLPVRVMHALGIRRLIITNAAGGIRPELTPGSIGLIKDHINLMGTSPLIGPYDPFLGVRFPDMSDPYTSDLRRLAQKIAGEEGIHLYETTFGAVIGPAFETEAEIRMLQILGIDTVGMSVVPEVLVARQLGMEVLGLTAVTDQSLPGAMNSVSHEQVNHVAAELGPRFRGLLRAIIRAL